MSLYNVTRKVVNILKNALRVVPVGKRDGPVGSRSPSSCLVYSQGCRVLGIQRDVYPGNFRPISNAQRGIRDNGIVTTILYLWTETKKKRMVREEGR